MLKSNGELFNIHEGDAIFPGEPGYTPRSYTHDELMQCFEGPSDFQGYWGCGNVEKTPIKQFLEMFAKLSTSEQSMLLSRMEVTIRI